MEAKHRNEYAEEELIELKTRLTDYWDKSRNRESESVNDLEKHLWLANGAGAAASVNFIITNTAFNNYQWLGSCSFIAGLVFLISLKFLSAHIASRDRYRFQDAKNKFDAGKEKAAIFDGIRDKFFSWLHCLYIWLQRLAGLTFLLGLVLTLLGIKQVHLIDTPSLQERSSIQISAPESNSQKTPPIPNLKPAPANK